MIALDISQCNKCLDFAPIQPWPQSLPLYSWKKYLLCGFERENGEVIELEDNTFAGLIKDVYPSLTLPEVARLVAKIQINIPSIVPIEVIKAYGISPSDSTLQLLNRLSETPIEFQNWCSEKKLKLGDIAPLNSAEVVNALISNLGKLGKLSPTKSEGTKALELLVELTLMNKLPASDADTFKEWFDSIYKLRYPNSSHIDETNKNWVEKLKKPHGIQMSWQRRGDATGLEFKFFASHPEELSKRLQSLSKVKNQIEEIEESPWT